ncbi:hypothetical protein GVX82_05160 [Patescibacteria group bacterium]|jgi:antitoxin (DNA-binding transcriptional repressor) of toxin-antitoxin stability system|nr:hypothetical protein [Patescibacteria group bacterium]
MGKRPAQQTISVRELHTNMKKITEAVARGERFTVVKNATPVFEITPLQPPAPRTLADWEHIQFSLDEPQNLSGTVDEIVYRA